MCHGAIKYWRLLFSFASEHTKVKNLHSNSAVAKPGWTASFKGTILAVHGAQRGMEDHQAPCTQSFNRK
jgi:hypothetical protein